MFKKSYKFCNFIVRRVGLECVALMVRPIVNVFDDSGTEVASSDLNTPLLLRGRVNLIARPKVADILSEFELRKKQ